MIIYGYSDNVNKIVVYGKDGSKFTRKLAVNGINELTNIYTYYNKQDGQLHAINKSLITRIRLYNDNKFVYEIKED